MNGFFQFFFCFILFLFFWFSIQRQCTVCIYSLLSIMKVEENLSFLYFSSYFILFFFHDFYSSYQASSLVIRQLD